MIVKKDKDSEPKKKKSLYLVIVIYVRNEPGIRHNPFC